MRHPHGVALAGFALPRRVPGKPGSHRGPHEAGLAGPPDRGSAPPGGSNGADGWGPHQASLVGCPGRVPRQVDRGVAIAMVVGPTTIAPPALGPADGLDAIAAMTRLRAADALSLRPSPQAHQGASWPPDQATSATPPSEAHAARPAQRPLGYGVAGAWEMGEVWMADPDPLVARHGRPGRPRARADAGEGAEAVARGRAWPGSPWAGRRRGGIDGGRWPCHPRLEARRAASASSQPP